MLQTQPPPLSPGRLARLHPSARRHPHAGPVVYYVANLDRWPVDEGAGGHVAKIGTTVDLPLRTERYQRAHAARLVVLAWEPGGPLVEQDRHHEYADLRWSGRRDWFYLGTPLLDHVLRLRNGETLEEVESWA